VGFVLQGMKPAAAQAAEWWQGTVLITYSYSQLIFNKPKTQHGEKTIFPTNIVKKTGYPHVENCK
jgi:hypothetical protein